MNVTNVKNTVAFLKIPMCLNRLFLFLSGSMILEFAYCLPLCMSSFVFSADEQLPVVKKGIVLVMHVQINEMSLDLQLPCVFICVSWNFELWKTTEYVITITKDR